MKQFSVLLACLFASLTSYSQISSDLIKTDFVLSQRRVDFDKQMREQLINGSFAQSLDSKTEDKYKEALWAISQFLLQSSEIEHGFLTLFEKYSSLEIDTKRAFLEAVYGAYPSAYQKEIEQLFQNETNPKLFTMQALYLYRNNSSNANKSKILQLMENQFKNYQETIVLSEMENYLVNHHTFSTSPTPDVSLLFEQQKSLGQEIIYSFQRWNRDYPGLAIIQFADGSFAKDTAGKLLSFQQLARSASDLPYFITNGSTPQGIYSIQGTEVSHNNFIGPTPNIQLIMPNETDSLFWHTTYDSSKDALTNYLQLLPKVWQSYMPMQEAFNAGKAGRTEIIAHGTTIDPEYFKNKPYYPLTPTLGCLCAKEIWNIFNGRFLESDQFTLTKTFLTTPSTKGYLMVINLDNLDKPVAADEIEKVVKQFELKK